jgi:hypothetical protein
MLHAAHALPSPYSQPYSISTATSPSHPLTSPCKRSIASPSHVPPKMPRLDFTCSSRAPPDSAAPYHAWRDCRAEAVEAAPAQHQPQCQCTPDSVQAFVTEALRSRALHVSPAALDFSSRAVLGMVCAASRSQNQASLALVPYKASDDVLMESLTHFQENDQHHQRCQQQASRLLDRLQQQQQQQQQNSYHHHRHHHHHQQQQQQDAHKYLHMQPCSPETIPPLLPAPKRRRVAASAACDSSGMHCS